MALKTTPEADIYHYGCATGTWEVRRNSPSYRRLNIASVVEKPTVEYARANLAVAGLPPGEYLTAFGLYVISESSIFSKLREVEASSGGKVTHRHHYPPPNTHYPPPTTHCPLACLRSCPQ